MKKLGYIILLLCLGLSLVASGAERCMVKQCGCCPVNCCGRCHVSQPDQDRGIPFAVDADQLRDPFPAAVPRNELRPCPWIISLVEDAVLTNLIVDTRSHPPIGPPLV